MLLAYFNGVNLAAGGLIIITSLFTYCLPPTARETSSTPDAKNCQVDFGNKKPGRFLSRAQIDFSPD